MEKDWNKVIISEASAAALFSVPPFLGRIFARFYCVSMAHFLPGATALLSASVFQHRLVPTFANLLCAFLCLHPPHLFVLFGGKFPRSAVLTPRCHFVSCLSCICTSRLLISSGFLRMSVNTHHCLCRLSSCTQS